MHPLDVALPRLVLLQPAIFIYLRIHFSIFLLNKTENSTYRNEVPINNAFRAESKK